MRAGYRPFMDTTDRPSASESEQSAPEYATFTCRDCKKSHTYPAELPEAEARSVALKVAWEHRFCKHGHRKNVKYR